MRAHAYNLVYLMSCCLNSHL